MCKSNYNTDSITIYCAPYCHFFKYRTMLNSQLISMKQLDITYNINKELFHPCRQKNDHL